ncbi:MAG TPA: hypothetical protein VG370_02105 [Chloroflexota bacterium]|jgi:hypothetical protein|nr:hypothetical protein [Chloroflexota bacterium]
MPIQIDQKFPRCQLCGKIIPLRAERIELGLPGARPIGFCSLWCRDEYAARSGPPAAADRGRPVEEG